MCCTLECAKMRPFEFDCSPGKIGTILPELYPMLWSAMAIYQQIDSNIFSYFLGVLCIHFIFVYQWLFGISITVYRSSHYRVGSHMQNRCSGEEIMYVDHL